MGIRTNIGGFKMIKLYDKVKTLLQMNPEFRDSDKKLYWDICHRKGYVRYDGVMTKQNFLAAPAFESVSRARRKVQENHLELRSSKNVQKAKNLKESKKGYFPYHERY